MRVFHVCSDTAYGCLAAVSELAIAQRRLDLEVGVVLVGDQRQRVSDFRRHRMKSSGVTPHMLHLPQLRPWMRPRIVARGVGIQTATPALVRLIEGCDLVHGHGSLGSVCAHHAARQAGIPVVGTRHGVEPGSLRPLVWKALAPRLDGFVSLVASSERRLQLPDSSPNRQTYRNGIDAAAWREMVRVASDLRVDLGVAPTEFAIGVVGRIVPEKRQKFLLQTLASAPQDGIHVLLIGDGPQRSELERMASAHGWRRRTHFLGYVDDMPAVYRALDLLVVASTRESQSMVILEAMAAGVPVVASSAGSTPWLLGGGAGWLFHPLDGPALNHAVHELRTDPGLRQDLVGKAYQRVTQLFSSSAAAREYVERLYRQALDLHRARKGSGNA